MRSDLKIREEGKGLPIFFFFINLWLIINILMNFLLFNNSTFSSNTNNTLSSNQINGERVFSRLRFVTFFSIKILNLEFELYIQILFEFVWLMFFEFDVFLNPFFYLFLKFKIYLYSSHIVYINCSNNSSIVQIWIVWIKW